MKFALTPLNVTVLAPSKLVPLIWTLVPTGPLAGPKSVMVGVTRKLPVLLAEPLGVVTPIGPLVAPVGTVAWMAVAEVTEKLAFVPLKVTELAPSKPVPLIWMLVPTGALAGAKSEIVGGVGGGGLVIAPPSHASKVNAFE